MPVKAGFEFGPCLNSVHDKQDESSPDVSIPTNDKGNLNGLD